MSETGKKRFDGLKYVALNIIVSSGYVDKLHISRCSLVGRDLSGVLATDRTR